MFNSTMLIVLYVIYIHVHSARITQFSKALMIGSQRHRVEGGRGRYNK